MPSAWFKRLTATRDAPRYAKGYKGYQETAGDKRSFERIRQAEYRYGIRLRKLARQVGEIVNGFPVGTMESSAALTKLLRQYAEALTPWSLATANAMLAEVERRDEQAWAVRTKDMSEALKAELKSAPTGVILRQMQAEQLKYISKIPLDAAQRVQDLTMAGLLGARRAEDIAKEIRAQGQVSEAYANLVARTEVGRVATNLTAARATHIGSTEYIWRTAEDSDVRPSHRKLEGTTHRWDNPPLCDAPNYHAHPGAIFNCRCYPEVIIPDIYK